MITEDYDDTKNITKHIQNARTNTKYKYKKQLFITFVHFIDCSNQTSITLVRKKIFLFYKKYYEADAV